MDEEDDARETDYFFERSDVLRSGRGRLRRRKRRSCEPSFGAKKPLGADARRNNSGSLHEGDDSRRLRPPWRVVQFNDCGESMPGQADETWEYRGRDAGGGYRLHVEFDDNGAAQLVAKIPDATPHGEATTANATSSEPRGMPM